MTLLLYILLPPLCIMAIPPTKRPGALAERLMFGIALHEFLLLAIGTVLGLTHHLTPYNYAAITWCAALPLALLTWRHGIHFEFPPVVRWLRTLRGRTAFLLAALLAVAYALQLGFDARYGIRHVDGLIYHIPRAIFWLQQNGFDAWTTPKWEQIGLPIAADLILCQKILLGTGWRGVGYLSCLLSVGAVACVYLAALDFRLPRWHAAMTALLFGSFPGVGLRIWTANSDIAAAFPVLASYVALHRIEKIKFGLPIFLVLNGIALACKPTVAPLALLLGGVSLWQCRHKLGDLRAITLPCLAVILASALVISSYWPVYAAFSDILGGDGGKGYKAASVQEFTHNAVLSAGHWLLEPIGYLAPVMENQMKGAAKAVYNSLGANLEELPESWKPWPAQDVGRTGLASLLLLPALFAGLAASARIPAALIFLLGFVSLSGVIRFSPYAARYLVVLFAGYALLWGGTGLFRRGNRRWILAALVALNVCALIGVVSLRYYHDAKKSQPGGTYDYISAEDRRTVAGTLKGRPLLAIAHPYDSLDALLVGPTIEYPLAYLSCLADENWQREFHKASLRSNWLVIVHDGKESMMGPTWHRPGVHAYSDVSNQALENALTETGWQPYRRNRHVDLWRFSEGSKP